jgi:predicted TIM-barrel fold metal-dependent hydrolase
MFLSESRRRVVLSPLISPATGPVIRRIAMNSLPYSLIDCDNHYYEPDDCFSRHIESRFRDRTVWVERERDDGFGIMRLGEERLNFFSVGVGDYVGAPGAMKAFFKGDVDIGGAVNANAIRAIDCPEFINKDTRLKRMDEQDVEACVMIPTLGCGVEYQLRKPMHHDVAYPSIRAFNRWVAEDWGWGGDGRVFSTAMMSLLDVTQALLELERVIKEGCRLVQINTGPIEGRSPADPHFDPFWARVQEAGLIVTYHIGSGPFTELHAAPWGEPANPPSHRFTAFNMYVGMGERTVVDQLAATIFQNLFGRFPRLQFLIVEFGAAWLPHLLKTMDKIYRLADHKSRWPYGKPELPSEVFRKHFKIVPFHEDDFSHIAKSVGVDVILNGSDYPHPEGLLWPAEMVEEMEGFSEGEIYQMMRGNAAKMLGIGA